MKKSKKNCIFTSAGDFNNVSQWVGAGERSWDLVSVYYGTNQEKIDIVKSASDIFFKQRGSKFQNLYSLNIKEPELLINYDYIWVMDDDLIISPDEIEDAFEQMSKWDLWVAQPGFHPDGKISHSITESNSATHLRYVDFVEVTCPLFKSSKLLDFLEVYDGSLVGYGIDYWIAHHLKSNYFYKFAILDSIRILNPLDEAKNGREIDKLQSLEDRINHCNLVLASLGIEQNVPKNLYYVFKAESNKNIMEYHSKFFSKLMIKLRENFKRKR